MSTVAHDPKFAHRTFGVKCNSGRFKCNGTSDPTSVYGEGFTVTYSAVNQYLVTFDGAYRNLLAVHVSASGAATPPAVTAETIVDGVYDDASFKVAYLTQDAVSGLYDDDTLPVNGDAVWIHFSADFYDVGSDGLWPVLSPSPSWSRARCDGRKWSNPIFPTRARSIAWFVRGWQNSTTS
jgi:hypothetical protein